MSNTDKLLDEYEASDSVSPLNNSGFASPNSCGAVEKSLDLYGSCFSNNFLNDHYEPPIYLHYDKPKYLRIGDWDALVPAKRDALKERQMNMKRANIKYLYENTQIEAIVNLILSVVINHQPENICEFVCAFFIRNSRESLEQQIEEELFMIQQQMLQKNLQRDD